MVTLIYYLTKTSRNWVLLGLVDVTAWCHHASIFSLSFVMMAWSLNLSPHGYRRLPVHMEITILDRMTGPHLLSFHFSRQETFLGTMFPLNFLCVSQIKSMPLGHFHKTRWESELLTLWIWPMTIQYFRPQESALDIKQNLYSVIKKTKLGWCRLVPNLLTVTYKGYLAYLLEAVYSHPTDTVSDLSTAL